MVVVAVVAVVAAMAAVATMATGSRLQAGEERPPESAEASILCPAMARMLSIAGNV